MFLEKQKIVSQSQAVDIQVSVLHSFNLILNSNCSSYICSSKLAWEFDLFHCANFGLQSYSQHWDGVFHAHTFGGCYICECGGDTVSYETWVGV
jgi:hypothetical protein